MKVLFVYFNKDYRPRTLLSLNILDTMVKNAGHKTRIFDTSFYLDALSDEIKKQTGAGIHKQIKNLKIPLKQNILFEDFKKIILSFCPDIVAFSFYAVNTDLQRKLLIPFKEEFPHIPIIAGGPQATINPAKSLCEEKYIDYVCCGEGESLMLDVCNRIENNQHIEGIKGLWYRDKVGGIVNSGIANMTDMNAIPIQNLDSYDPIQIYGLFDGNAYRMGHVEFTRGCPYNCSYCGSGSIKKIYESSGRKYVRHKDPELAVKEYKFLKEKYNLEMFYFIDGTFLAMPIDTLKRLAYLYKKEVDLPFISLVHPNTVSDTTAELLKYMGCIHSSMGVESGIAKYRSEFLNRKMSNEQIIRSVKMLTSNKIHVSAYNIIGMPGMDRNHVFETIRLNKIAKPSSSIVSIFIPYSDSDMTKKMISKGILDINKVKISSGLSPTVEIDDMSHSEINGLFNTFNIYMKFPEWTYKFVKLLEYNNAISNVIRKIIYKIIKYLDKKPNIRPKSKIVLKKYYMEIT